MDTINIFILNKKIIKTKRIYKNLNEMSLQKNYLQIIKYILNYSNNNKSLANFLKIRKKKIFISVLSISIYSKTLLRTNKVFSFFKKN